MKTLTFALLICFVSLPVFSQENSTKVSMGFSFNPQLSDKIPGYLTRHYDDHFKLSWTAGVFLKKQIADKFSIQSGMYLSNKGSAYQYQFLLNDTIRDLLLASEGKYPEESYSESNHYFIDIPLTLNYLLHKGRKLSYYSRFGLIGNIYVASEGFTKTDYNDGSQGVWYRHFNYWQLKEDFIVRMLNLSVCLALGVEHSINSNFGLFIEPNFDMSILPLYNSHSSNKPRYYNIGLSFGFLIH
jgi:hypothetical protein